MTMMRVRVDNPIDRDFTMVPDAVWRLDLSFRAKALFVYLLSFRHGGVPPVAQIEADTGLGRDARQGALRELIAAKLASWDVPACPRTGRRFGRELVVTTRPLIAACLDRDVSARGPENPAVGSDHASEAPEGLKTRRSGNQAHRAGISGGMGLKTRRSKEEREREKARAARAPASSSSILKRPARPAGPAVAAGERVAPEVAEALRSFHRRPVADADRPAIARWLWSRGVDVLDAPGLSALREALRRAGAEKLVPV